MEQDSITPADERPDLTPVWCERCQMWVPEEREPHIGFPEDVHHRAADYPAPEERDDA